MCGLAGIAGNNDPAELAVVAESMAESLEHRGPDDVGVWSEPGIALAHRRLAIIDLSAAGHQPMQSPGGRYCIAYNGEIYNHLELRAELEDIRWRGHSDTETLLAALEAWGIEATLKRLTGMFAFALWDRSDRRLVLARDRLGEKPLYYGWIDGCLAFGSELKALVAHPRWPGDIDRDALASFMRYGYVPLPHSIYRGVRKLLPGTFATFGLSEAPGTFPSPQPYWSALEVASRPTVASLSDGAAVDELERRLQQAVTRQMVSDVPLGAFLSGGIDSTTVVALMQATSSRPVRTFTIGFNEGDYDEARHAAAVAAHLGTDHTSFDLTADDALAVIPRLPQMFDEPFGDSSAIPTFLVSSLARQHVTVSLSGDGGDELFGGYNRYNWGDRIWRRIGGLPVGLRRLAGAAMVALPPPSWDTLAGLLRGPSRGRLYLPDFGDRLHKLASVMDVASSAELYQRLVSQHREPGSLIIGASEPEAWADTESARFAGRGFVEEMMFHDLVGYLVDDILTKVDRAAMAVSLETRVPMLDLHLVEFAWSLPMSLKVRDGKGKWLLRQVLDRYVPKGLMDRPKQGFAIPLASWLRGPLRDWGEGLLAEERLRREGFLEPALVRSKWQEHLSGRRNWQHWLWNVLTFQAWMDALRR